MFTKVKKELVFIFTMIFLATLVLVWSSPSEARSHRSSSYKSRSYHKPRVVHKTKVIRKTTVINNTRHMSSPVAAGGTGILGTMVGTAGGVVAGNAISDMLRDDPAPTPQADQQSVPDLTCPEGFVCKFINGAWQLTPKG